MVDTLEPVQLIGEAWSQRSSLLTNTMMVGRSRDTANLYSTRL